MANPNTAKRARAGSYGMAVAVATAIPLTAAPAPAYAAWDVVAPATAAATARTMPAGGLPTGTASGAAVTVRWPAAEVAAGTPVTGYEVVRYDADTGAPYPVSAGCAGRRQVPHCTDTAPDGRWRYRVRPVHGLRWVGELGASSKPVTVATRAAATTVSFPADGGGYAAAGLRAGCGTPNAVDICGTATPAGGTEIATVAVSVRHGTGRYWDPDTGRFSSEPEILFPVGSGTTNWRVPFPLANFPVDGEYRLRAVATDEFGRHASAASVFAIDGVVDRERPGANP